MAAVKACTFITSRLFRFSVRQNLPLLSNVVIKGHRQLYVHLSQARLLSTGHTLLTPEGTGYKYTNRYSSRYQEEEEDEYEIDEDDLEKLRHEHREQARAQHKAKEGVTFADFPVNDQLLASLAKLGYQEPFVIQTETLKHTLGGRDVIAKAVTGSGKTLCFAIPIVHKIQERPRDGKCKNPRAIVISPTRELCLQLHKAIQELDPRVKCVPVYGGQKYDIQERKILRGCDVLCATPGRLNDHLERGLFTLDEVEFLCLDEADELLTPNFKEQIEDVLQGCPEGKQMMLFSATIPPHIQSLTQAYMNDPELVDITKDDNYASPLSVQHKCIKCETDEMVPVLVTLIREYNPQRCLIFMETKRLTKAVTMDLSRCGAKAEYINSDLSQNRRENLMAAFRQGKIRILVATDVAARGLDVPEIDLIVQVKPPTNGTEYYVHRSGRTGRAGRDGVAVMLHSGTETEWRVIREVENLVKLEHVSPPDISYLKDVDFRTYIPVSFRGQSSNQGRKSFGYGRSRFSDRNRGFGRSYGGRFNDPRDSYRYGGRGRDSYGHGGRDSFDDDEEGGRYNRRDSFSQRRRNKFDEDDF